MTADDERASEAKPEQGYRSLPPETRPEEVIATVDPTRCQTHTRGGMSIIIAPCKTAEPAQG